MTDKFKKDIVSGLYKPATLNFMHNQPRRDKAFCYCSNNIHRGYMSTKMVRKHKCFEKVCPYLKPCDHPHWDQIYSKRAQKLISSIEKRFNLGMDYFIFNKKTFQKKDLQKLDSFIRENKIYSVEQLVFGQNDNINKKKGVSMVTFSENLKTWKTAKKITTKDLGKRSGLGEPVINDLLAGNIAPTEAEIQKISMVFQVPSSTFMRGVKVEAINNASTINELSPQDKRLVEYFSYPSELRCAISRDLVDFVTRCYVNAGFAATMSEACIAIGLPRGTFSNVKNMRYSFSESAINTILSSDVIDRDEFLNKMEHLGNKYTPNYNYALAHKCYGLSDDKISVLVGNDRRAQYQVRKYLQGCSPKLGALYCGVLHESWDDFSTRIFSVSDFTGAKKKEIKQILNKCSTNKCAKSYCESNLTETDDKMNGKEITEPNKRTQDLKEQAQSKSAEFHLEVSEDKLLKAYRKLTDEHKKEVLKIVDKYFWEDM